MNQLRLLLSCLVMLSCLLVPSCSTSQQARAREVQEGAEVVIAALAPMLKPEDLARVQREIAQLDGGAQTAAAAIQRIAAIIAALAPPGGGAGSPVAPR